MASKPRLKGSKWEYVVKRAGLLDKPLYLSFASTEEGDRVVANIEKMLDRGVVPHALLGAQAPARQMNLNRVLGQYLLEGHPSRKDRNVLGAVINADGETLVAGLDIEWVDAWIDRMKREERLAPSTIRSKVGAVARGLEWARRKDLVSLSENPFRNLQGSYSQYSEMDKALTGGGREDVERDRRLEGDEEERIRAVIRGGVLKRKFRDRILEHPNELLADFDLALETAMRLRERYTLTADQVNLGRRTIFLERTKNGDSRQVPLSSVAVRVLEGLVAGKRGGEPVFPWWDGRLDDAVLKKTTDWLSHLYSSIMDAAGCPDVTEHDIRHEATSRFFEKTNLPGEAIMKITGHNSHRMLMRYLKLRGSDLASQLW